MTSILAVFARLGIDPDAHWTGGQERPIAVVQRGGRPTLELF